MSSVFQHFTFGFQQVSKLFHDFTTRSYKIQTYANMLPLFSNQLHNLFQHFHWFAIIVPHISAPYRGCSSIFSTPRIGFHQCFLPFFVSSTFTIVSLFFTFYVHPFSCRRHLLSSWHCLYVAFILIYVVINVGHL